MRQSERLKDAAMGQIDLLSPLVVAARAMREPSVQVIAVADAPGAASPWSLHERVRHQNPAVTWEGTIVGTPETHPWDCCAGMVLVAMGERVERMAISLLRLAV